MSLLRPFPQITRPKRPRHGPQTRRGRLGDFYPLEWPKITRRDLAYQLLGYERHNRAAELLLELRVFVGKSIYRRLCKCRHCGNTIGEFL